MPDPLSDSERRALVAWCGDNRFTLAQAKFATVKVRNWSEGSGKIKACWVATIQNAMTAGWALEGFDQVRGTALQVPEFKPPEKQPEMTDEEKAEIKDELAAFRAKHARGQA